VVGHTGAHRVWLPVRVGAEGPVAQLRRGGRRLPGLGVGCGGCLAPHHDDLAGLVGDEIPHVGVVKVREDVGGLGLGNAREHWRIARQLGGGGEEIGKDGEGLDRARRRAGRHRGDRAVDVAHRHVGQRDAAGFVESWVRHVDPQGKGADFGRGEQVIAVLSAGRRRVGADRHRPVALGRVGRSGGVCERVVAPGVGDDPVVGNVVERATHKAVGVQRHVSGVGICPRQDDLLAGKEHVITNAPVGGVRIGITDVLGVFGCLDLPGVIDVRRRRVDAPRRGDGENEYGDDAPRSVETNLHVELPDHSMISNCFLMEIL